MQSSPKLVRVPVRQRVGPLPYCGDRLELPRPVLAPSFGQICIRLPFRSDSPVWTSSTAHDRLLNYAVWRLAAADRETPSINLSPAECVHRCHSVAGNLCIRTNPHRHFRQEQNSHTSRFRIYEESSL